MLLLFQDSAVQEKSKECLSWTASEDGGRPYKLLSVEIRTKLSSSGNIIKEDAHSIYLTNCTIYDQLRVINFSHVKVGINIVLGCI
jgi:hypothetical protein